MGLLDDAIREHLELKRRHGADPSEVERQEHEALGPARRAAAAAAELDDDEGAVTATEFDDDEPEAYEDDDVVFDDEPPAATRAPVAVEEPERPVARDGAADRFAPADRGDREPAEDVVEELEPVDEADLAPPPPAERVPVAEPEPEPERPEPERRDREPAAERAEEADADEEDVIEETPEFLQETPEHDRLWFEQKPPRDFEF